MAGRLAVQNGRGRHWLPALLALCLTPLAGVPAPAHAAEVVQPSEAALRAAIAGRAGKDLRGFYAVRGNRPLWLDGSGRISPAAGELIRQMRGAALDGLDPRKLKPAALEKTLAKAEEKGSADALARAEIALSQGYVRYVQALRQAPREPMIYETQALAPVVPTPAAALSALGKGAPIEAQVRGMTWMNPLYAPLRAELASGRYPAAQADLIARNLARLRALPPIPSGRWVLIDAASARLWMYEGAKAVGSMKVVVGKAETQTPAMAGFLRYAIVNPYWNMPDDLMPSRVTEKVLRSGPGVLASQGYQVLASWDADAEVVDPRKVDWQAVAAGRQTVRVRQLPGRANFMGAVKFMFPNPQGIYLHDTPERELLRHDARQYSNGCVRLEDAQKLGRWLMGKPLPRSKQPETRLELPEIVPLYITYLTAQPGAKGGVAFRPDVYGRDGLGSPGLTAGDFARQADSFLTEGGVNRPWIAAALRASQ